ncbi:MAG: hypothetical protein MJ252_22510 [archaeon]|nr:hypothetical protein [archaeon]
MEFLKKPNNLLKIVDSILIFFSFCFMVLNLLQFNFNYVNFALYEESLEVWKELPVITPDADSYDEIRELNGETNYEPEVDYPVFSNFPASSEGYYCNDTDITKKGEIPKKLINSECIVLAATEENLIAQWKNFGSWAEFAYLGFNYFDLLEKGYISKNKDCGKDKKYCGIIDSRNQYLCLPEDIPCPMTEMIISTTDDLPGYENYSKYEEYFDGEPIYWYYSNKIIKPTSTITVHFSIDTEIPCADPTHPSGEIFSYDLLENFDKFVNNECKEEIGGNKKSLYYRLLDEYKNSTDLYMENKSKFPIYQTLPDSVKSKWDKLKLNLYARSYPGIDVDLYKEVKEQISKIDSNLLEDKLGETDYRMQMVNFFFLVCFICSFLLITFKSSQKCYYLIRTVRLSQDIFIFIFSLISIIIFKDLKINPNAFDEQLKATFSKTKRSFTIQYVFTILELSFGAFFVVMDIIGIKLTEKIEEQYKRVGTANSEFYN